MHGRFRGLPWGGILALVGALALLPARGHAQDARALFTQGQAAYETGDYETAASLWEQAYGMDARPLLQYNLAQAYERLGQLQDAIDAYEAFASGAPDDPRVPSARARIASLRTRLTQTAIMLSGGVDGASITIDGQDRGRLPHPDPLQVEPGNHRVVIRAAGYEDFVSTVSVSGGRRAQITVEMRAGQSGGASDTAGGGGIWLPGVFIAAGGGAVLIGGAITGGLALAAAGDAPSNTGPEADDARTLALVTDILIPTGVVIAAVGVVLMFVIPSGDGGGGEEASASVVPLLGPDFAGAAVSGSF